MKKLGFILFILSFAIIFNGCKKDETVTKKDTVITWSNPADISFGTLLSATQLNATADVAGTFVYTPAIGTKLNEGINQDLKVDFTPTDATNYNNASKTIKINVIKAIDKPVANFTVSATSISVGDEVTFTSTSTNNPTSYSWVITGDAVFNPSSGTGNSIKVTFYQFGSVSVALTATNAGGSDTYTKTDVVNALTTSTINLGAMNNSYFSSISLSTGKTYSASVAATYSSEIDAIFNYSSATASKNLLASPFIAKDPNAVAFYSFVNITTWSTYNKTYFVAYLNTVSDKDMITALDNSSGQGVPLDNPNNTYGYKTTNGYYGRIVVKKIASSASDYISINLSILKIPK